MRQPWWRLGWAESGAVAGLLLIPALYLSTVHLRRADTAPAGYVATVSYHAGSTVIAALAGLLLTALLAVHLLGLRRWAAEWRPGAADSCTAIGMVAVLGLAVGFVCAMLAAYGARHGWGVDPVKAMGAIAENAAAVLLAAIAGPAYLVTRLALHDGVLPVRLGYLAGVATGVLILVGVLQPGLATWPALVWLMVSGVALALRREPAEPAERAVPAVPADPDVAAPTTD
ncbi:MAG TPA: hypothetical protein VH857_12500 [Actinomycetes bacterium]|nr:hypothetical protein [Actinomycetes bacterium]